MKRHIAISPKPLEAKRPVDGARCHHYWLIETAKGPKSRGQCRYCGSKREFMNYLTDDYGWEGKLKYNSEPLLLPVRGGKISGVLMN